MVHMAVGVKRRVTLTRWLYKFHQALSSTSMVVTSGVDDHAVFGLVE